MRDGLVYVAMGSQIELRVGRLDLQLATTTENGLHVVDASDPYDPVLLGQVPFLGWVEGVQLAGDYAYVANTWTGMRSIDVRDPRRPVGGRHVERPAVGRPWASVDALASRDAVGLAKENGSWS